MVTKRAGFCHQRSSTHRTDRLPAVLGEDSLSHHPLFHSQTTESSEQKEKEGLHEQEQSREKPHNCSFMTGQGHKQAVLVSEGRGREQWSLGQHGGGEETVRYTLVTFALTFIQ